MLKKNLRKKMFCKEELLELHNLLSKLYNEEKLKNTEKDDTLHLRMRTKEILNSYK